MAQDECFVRVRPERKTKWHRLRANPKNHQRTSEFFCTGWIFHRKWPRGSFRTQPGRWFAGPGGVGEYRKERAHDAPCRAVCGGSDPQARGVRPLQKVL